MLMLCLILNNVFPILLRVAYFVNDISKTSFGTADNFLRNLIFCFFPACHHGALFIWLFVRKNEAYLNNSGSETALPLYFIVSVLKINC